jgi:hypothetical protein
MNYSPSRLSIQSYLAALSHGLDRRKAIRAIVSQETQHYLPADKPDELTELLIGAA